MSGDTSAKSETSEETVSVSPGGAMKPVGASLSRYTVIEEIGSGGMGVVYRAYDPRLEREVALKLLRFEARSEAQARLLREAQAMAQLSHPNVLPVYDVAADGDQLFIAMEFVAGTDLRTRLRDHTLSWSRVLELFVQAGRGVAAAHLAGLVHRDFKPANVMVGDDGRVRVMDFGLARENTDVGGELDATDDPVASSSTSGPRLAAGLTETGMTVGTPAYMAPEQHKGHAADARADQFAFCVALFEALYGRRPFPGPSPRELAKQKREGKLAEVTTSPVPGWVHRVIARGLAPRPADRWPSMNTLLAELDREPPGRRRILLAGGAAVVLASTAMVVHARRNEGADACAGAEVALQEVWNDEVKDRAGAAFAATELAYAPSTWERVQATVDAGAADWVTAHREACEATVPGRDQSAQLLDRRMACLDGWRRRVAALTDVWVEADRAAVEQSIQATSKLPAIEPCADRERLLAAVPPPADPALADRVEAVRNRLEVSRAARDSGHFEDAATLAEEALQEATATGYTPVEAEARLVLGIAEDALARYDEATANLREAYFLAQGAGDDALGVRAATQVALVVATRRASYDVGLEWIDHAEAMLARMGGDPILEGRLLETRGRIQTRIGKYDEAIAVLERSVELRRAAAGPEELSASLALDALGSAYRSKGKYDAALERFSTALSIREASLGPDHPRTAIATNNVANALLALGRWDEAIARYQAALKVLRAAHGDVHPDIAMVLNNLGGCYLQMGSIDASVRPLREALAIRTETLGPDHPDTGGTHLNLAATLVALHRLQESEPHYRRALEVFEKLGADHPYVAKALSGLGGNLIDQERYDEALVVYGRAITILAALSEAHPDLALSLNNQGRALMGVGRNEEALEVFEQAVQIWNETLGPDHPDTAYGLFYVAKALDVLGRRDEAIAEYERALKPFADAEFSPRGARIRWGLARLLDRRNPRAVDLAREARVHLVKGGEADRHVVEAIDRWLER